MAMVGAAAGGLRILVVEDNPLSQKVMSAMLESCGHRVTVVPDGAAGLMQVAGNPPGTFDLVLMDMRMPVMDGLEATTRIRSLDPERAGVPIVALTANAFKEDELECLAAGMDGYVAKPVTMDTVFGEIGRVLGNSWSVGRVYVPLSTEGVSHVASALDTGGGGCSTDSTVPSGGG